MNGRTPIKAFVAQGNAKGGHHSDPVSRLTAPREGQLSADNHLCTIRFLKVIERELPEGKLVQVILDNYAADVQVGSGDARGR